MGQSSSLPDNALHCLRVADGSPAHGNIEPFFDYVVGIESDGEYTLDPTAVRVGEVNLRVYNAKSQRIRGGSCPPLFR
jgi:hypothetical protein